MARILFVIPALAGGGAERQLCVLANGLQESGHSVTIAVFRRGGPYESTLLAGSRVTVVSLDKRSTAETLRFLSRAVQLGRRLRPDVIYGFLDLGNLVATAIAAFVREARLVWGVRVARLDVTQYDRLAQVIARLARWCSRVPDAVICNSHAGAEACVDDGYPSSLMHVVPNGIDTDRFFPDAAGAARLRKEWGIPASMPIVGLVARLDPVKDHETFIAAARLLLQRRTDVRFVCVGDGEDPYRQNILKQIEQSGLGHFLIRSGFRDDMTAVNSAFDVATSCSLSEGFSNTLAEAMACGVHCVATNVGDSRVLIGETGLVVPARNPQSLADAWDSVLSMDARAAMLSPRERIVTNYSVGAMVQSTLSLLVGRLARAGAIDRAEIHQ